MFTTKYVVAVIVILGAVGDAAAERPTSQSAIDTPLSSQSLLLDITRINGRLIAVGEQGHVLYSDDDGANWANGSVPTSLMLTSVCFATETKGWVVGHEGTILATTDGGLNWEIQLDARQLATQQFKQAQEDLLARQTELDTLDPTANREDAIMALEDAEFDLEDTEEMLMDGVTTPLLTISCLNESTAYALGAYGLALATSDGGLHWTLISNHLDNPEGFHWYAMTRSNAGTLYIAGEAGILNRSRDNGESWQPLDANYQGSLFGIVAIADDSVVAFGLRGNVFRSIDQGDTWQRLTTPGQSTLMGGSLLTDESMVLVGGNGMVLRSPDQGQTFIQVDSKTRKTLSAVTTNSKDELVVVGFGGVSTLAKQAIKP